MEAVTYRSAWLIDGAGAHPMEDAAVTIENGQIVDIGPGAKSGRETVDLGDVTLLPGLVDAHVHLVWNSGRVPHEEVLLDNDPARTVLRMAGRARTFLTNGTTTVRDLGATDSLSIPLARAISAGEVLGPRVVAAGRAIAMTGGHAWHICVEADGPDGVRQAVREEIKRGARAIKLMASAGVYDEGRNLDEPQFTSAELAAATDEAHRAGVRVAAHAYTPSNIRAAIDAGVDTIEHGSMIDNETASLLKAKDAWLVPTMMASHCIAQQAASLGTPEYMQKKAGSVRAAVRDNVANALSRGVPIAGGSDSGGAGVPHGNLAYEAELFTELGADPVQAVEIVTRCSAQAIGLGDLVGTLEPGKRADLVAVSGNLAKNIRSLRDITLVVKDGRVVPGVHK